MFAKDELALNIEEFEKVKPWLFENHPDKYVIFYKQNFSGAFDTSSEAGTYAMDNYGRGPYLIRKVTNKPKSIVINRFIRS